MGKSYVLQEIVRVRVDRGGYGVERFDAVDADVDQFVKFHFLF